MIGTYEIKCYAANPQMPLPPMFAFKDSPSSLRLLEIPKKIGQWNITTVKVAVNYPDNTLTTYTASRNGNVWVVTFNGCSITGKVANGLEVLADGIDENGDAVNGYVLGVGDIYILDRDADIEEAVSKHTMRYCEVMPETPVAGDVFIGSGALEIYDGTQWISIDIDLSEYATKSEVETTSEELRGAIAEVASDIPTTTSELTNDSGFITQASVPTKTSDLTNDSDFTTNTALNSELALKQDALTSAQLSNIERVPYIDPANTIVTFDDDSVGVYNVAGELTQAIKQEWERLAGAYVKNIKIGTNVTALGNSLFYRAYNNILTKVTIPNSVTSIGSGAFSGCTSLTKVTIPNSVTNIANSAFFGCSNLTSVTIPNSVTSIEGFAFRSCTSLSSVTIPESTTNIGENAFRQSGITNITIPNSISNIGTNAFLDCTNLTSLTFKGKTLAEVQTMSNYPWGISDTSIIKTWNDASQEWVLEQLSALEARIAALENN